jgi:hypothetical protein
MNLLIRQIILSILILGLHGVYEEITREFIIPPAQAAELVVLGGDTLKGVAIPAYFNPQVYAIIQDIVSCESSGRQYDENGEIVKGKAGELGIAQFKPETWEYFNNLRGTDLDIMSESDQLNMLRWGLETGRGNHWTCFSKI